MSRAQRNERCWSCGGVKPCHGPCETCMSRPEQALNVLLASAQADHAVGRRGGMSEAATRDVLSAQAHADHAVDAQPWIAHGRHRRAELMLQSEFRKLVPGRGYYVSYERHKRVSTVEFKLSDSSGKWAASTVIFEDQVANYTEEKAARIAKRWAELVGVQPAEDSGAGGGQ